MSQFSLINSIAKPRANILSIISTLALLLSVLVSRCLRRNQEQKVWEPLCQTAPACRGRLASAHRFFVSVHFPYSAHSSLLPLFHFLGPNRDSPPPPPASSSFFSFSFSLLYLSSCLSLTFRSLFIVGAWASSLPKQSWYLKSALYQKHFKVVFSVMLQRDE